MEFFLDKDNYCCVKNTANPDEQVIGDFLKEIFKAVITMLTLSLISLIKLKMMK